jgi:superfamily I DNA/RNA helicase
MKKKTAITDEQGAKAIKLIVEQYKNDHEAIHGRADDLLRDILMSLGYKKTIKEYDKLTKWCA